MLYSSLFSLILKYFSPTLKVYSFRYIILFFLELMLQTPL